MQDNISESLPTLCQPLGGTSGEWCPQPHLRGSVQPPACPGPYLPTGHHGQGHLVPEVKFSKRKLHGSLQALRRGNWSILSLQESSLPWPTHTVPGESLLKPLPLEAARAHTWFLPENSRGSLSLPPACCVSLPKFLTLSGPQFPPPYHVNTT